MGREYRILCYGDSNTWGAVGKWRETAAPSRRLDRACRWPEVLQQELGAGFQVYNQGMNGRTTIYGLPDQPWKSGEYGLVPCLYTHAPLDLVILMLGTNDLQAQPGLGFDDLGRGISRLVDVIRQHPRAGRGCVPPKILLLAPPQVCRAAPEGRVHVYDKMGGDRGRQLSLGFVQAYEKTAREKDCYFLNAQAYTQPCPADGVHLDEESHVRLGKAVAEAVKGEIFPPLDPLGGQDGWQWDGRNSRLYMRFHKAAPSAQGMDIWEDRAFILYDTGLCAVYDLSTRNPESLDCFPLGSYNRGVPDKNYLNHANSCMFGQAHYGDNPIPLLYVTTGAGTGADQDGYYYRCAVENILREVGAGGGERYSAQTLQTITYRPEGIEQTPFMPPCWGCPAFFVDTQGGFVYLFSAKYRTKRGCVPPGERNEYILTQFPLPALEEGPMVRLTPDHILQQFSVPSDVLFTQGGTLRDGCITYTFGCPQAGYPIHVLTFDLKRHKLAAHVGNLDQAFGGEEIECCAWYRGELLCNTNQGGIYALAMSPRRTEDRER